MPLRSLTLRLTLMFAGAAALVLILLGLAVGGAVDRHFEEQDVTEINAKLALTQRIIAKLRLPAELGRLPQQLDEALFGQHALLLRIVAADGSTVYASMHGGDARVPAAILAAPLADGPVRRSDLRRWEDEGQVYRGVALKLPSGSGAGLTVVLALDIEHHNEFMAAFRRTLWLAVLFGIVGTGLLAWAAARSGLRPLRRMAAVATGISAERLSERLAADDVPAEMADLAAAFNAMLARLEDSFRRLSDFSSDLAHELRTPISNLMMQSQVALSQARDGEAYREVLYSALEEYERLSRIIADMLFLAKADNGQLVAGDAPVDLAAEVHELFDFYEALADERGVRLACSGAASVRGDRLMLRRALSNLLSNAIRYTAAGATVDVELAVAAGQATVLVANPGTAIAAEHLPRLFDRFYRADPARQRSDGGQGGDSSGDGTGLGLAITRSIVVAHGGSISVSSSAGLTRFVLSLPALTA
jgi:two-component system heavy metal sensor histidine kinase CusS